MHHSVLDSWSAFSEPLEGRVAHLYADVKGFLTAGVGNLADGVSLAQQMPWRMPSGDLATKAEIAKQWRAVKDHSVYLSKRHYKYAADYSTMRLTEADIDTFVAQRLARTERTLQKYFHEWDAYPADAQLGCLSMAWAVGDGYPAIFKNFTRAANAGDWLGARASCKIKTEGNPGLIPRNKHNETCFGNAARVIEWDLDTSVIYWPTALTTRPAAAPTAPTLPSIDDADRARAVTMFDEYARELTADHVADGMREMAGIDTQRPTETDPEEEV
jgi:GH24 family phage-related lysozyme (muramidase)